MTRFCQCPLCGSGWSGIGHHFDPFSCTVIADGRSAQLRPIEARMFELLAAVAPLLVTHDEIEAHLWGDDADGGPLWIEKCKSSHLHRLRRAIAPLGLTIVNEHGRGFALHGWRRHVRVEAAE